MRLGARYYKCRWELVVERMDGYKSINYFLSIDFLISFVLVSQNSNFSENFDQRSKKNRYVLFRFRFRNYIIYRLLAMQLLLARLHHPLTRRQVRRRGFLQEDPFPHFKEKIITAYKQFVEQNAAEGFSIIDL